MVERANPMAAAGDEKARILASMADGLHAMAQPLTILRSSVAACVVPDITLDKQQRYLKLSAEQVQRACILFDHLQDLVIANQIEADRAPIDLVAMVSTLVEEQRPALWKRGIGLEMVASATLPLAAGDSSRTLQAIGAGLRIATAVSGSGNVIQMAISVRDPLVELTIHNDRPHGRSLFSLERLSLSLAQANILSQHGKYQQGDDPFRLCLGLPLLGSLP